MSTIELQTPEAIHAGSRSRLYALLSRGFRFPSAAEYAAVQTGALLDEVEAAVAALPYALAVPGTLGKGLSLSLEEFQQEYIALFDVGGPTGPPCFLYEGEIGGGRLKVIEEVLQFYHHFGLRLSQEQGKRDRPDHLATELSFMHALTFKEAELLDERKEVTSYRKAQRDFLKFHPVDFLSEVSARVGSRGIPFYSDLAQLSEVFCRADLAYLDAG